MTADFWRTDCPERGAGLHHAHWSQCDSHGVHPGSNTVHSWNTCCHCELTPETAKAYEEAEMKAKLADPDSLPLALPQPGGCPAQVHNALARMTPLIGDKGLEWPTCRNCDQQLEPKLATGAAIGPKWGIGRGWVSPRMKLRWMFLARLAQQDAEQNLPPFVPSPRLDG